MSTQETYLKGIADAIRAKTGLTGTIKASEFAAKIAAIPTGVAKPKWVQTTMGSGQPYAVCHGNGKFVAAANTGLFYSADGINWTKATNLPSSSMGWVGVCYGNGKFVAITNSNDSVAAYSTDGVNWTASTLPGSRNWSSVCYGNGKFVAVCNNALLPAYSTDGITWSSGRFPVKLEWSRVCYGNGKFVAVSTAIGSVAVYSTDGINWTQLTLTITWDQLVDVCYGNGKFVIIGSNRLQYSTDGINWTATDLPGSIVYAIGYGNGKFVILTYNDGAYISADCINWTRSTLLGNVADWQEVCYGDGKFVALQDSGIAAYLKDSFDEWE